MFHRNTGLLPLGLADSSSQILASTSYVPVSTHIPCGPHVAIHGHKNISRGEFIWWGGVAGPDASPRSADSKTENSLGLPQTFRPSASSRMGSKLLFLWLSPPQWSRLFHVFKEWQPESQRKEGLRIIAQVEPKKRISQHTPGSLA